MRKGEKIIRTHFLRIKAVRLQWQLSVMGLDLDPILVEDPELPVGLFRMRYGFGQKHRMLPCLSSQSSLN